MNKKNTLNAKNLGISGGVIWGGSLFLLTLIAVGTDYGREFLQLIATLYPGYTISGTGSLMALILGFVDGFVALYLLAIIYNWFNKKRDKKSSK